jgi:hypothetical protein
MNVDRACQGAWPWSPGLCPGKISNPERAGVKSEDQLHCGGTKSRNAPELIYTLASDLCRVVSIPQIWHFCFPLTRCTFMRHLHRRSGCIRKVDSTVRVPFSRNVLLQGFLQPPSKTYSAGRSLPFLSLISDFNFSVIRFGSRLPTPMSREPGHRSLMSSSVTTLYF